MTMNATVHAHALKHARGDYDLSQDFVQEAQIAWWRKGEVARLPDGESRWGCRYVARVARTYWRIRAEDAEKLQLIGPCLLLNDDPVFLIPVPIHTHDRRGRPRGPASPIVLHGEAYREHLRAQARARRARLRDAS